MSITVRAAEASDAAAIATLNDHVQAIHAEALPWRYKPLGTVTPAIVEAMLSHPAFFGVIAETDGSPAGYLIGEIAQMTESPFRYAAQILQVHHIVVHPDVLQRGIGTKLLDAAKAHGKAHGVTLMTLDVMAFNTKARAFFQRSGLETLSERRIIKIE